VNSTAHVKPHDPTVDDPASQAGAPELYAFGPFRLDVGSLRLLRDDEVVPLTPKVFDTLLMLVRHRDRLVSKEQLIASVWPHVAVSDDSLSQSISSLRRSLGDERSQPQYIATVPRRGYRFIATVVDLREEAAAASSAAEPPVAPDTSPPAPSYPAGAKPSTAGRRAAILASAVVIGALGASAVDRLSGGPPNVDAGRPLRFTIPAPPDTTIESSLILSPDSRRMAFVAQDGAGRTQLWVRDLDSADARALPGTDGASRPFWSPDGNMLGFFASGALKKVDLDGDPPQTVATVGLSAGGGTWGLTGRILYAGWRSGLYAVAADGGPPRPVTTLDASANEAWHMTPQFLPDGRHFLYHAASGDPAKSVTFVGSLDSPDRVALPDMDGAVFAPPAYLVYVRERTLMVQGFDPERLAVSGKPRALVGNVARPDRAGAISATAGGLLSFGGGIGDAHFVWFNRSGQALHSIDAPVVLHQPAFSRDVRQLLASGGSGGGRGVWTVDLERNAATRVADGGTTPAASPDGTAIAFTSDRIGGVFNIYIRRLGRTEDESLLQSSENKIVYDWSPDSQFIVYGTTNPQTKKDIWLLSMRGERRTQPFLVTPFNEIQAQVSPDGRWIAYASDESGQWDVYVQSFPNAGNKRAVSVGEGAQPQWRRDGRELYYLSSTHQLMAVEMDLASGGRIGSPQPLFRAPVWGDLSTYRSQYLVSPDGQRFLVDAFQFDNSRDSLNVIVNWVALLNRPL
jgi:eukaryotic-like serine/threonine-protein kinase